MSRSPREIILLAKLLRISRGESEEKSDQIFCYNNQNTEYECGHQYPPCQVQHVGPDENKKNKQVRNDAQAQQRAQDIHGYQHIKKLVQGQVVKTYKVKNDNS